MKAQIANHNGAPALILDGKPVFYGLMWGSGPTVKSYPLKESARYYGKAGVHFHTFDMGTTGPQPEWCGPNKNNNTDFDFSTLKPRLEHFIDADPEARFHLRIHLEMMGWWQELYPDECELLSDGSRKCQSYASTIWRKQANEFLLALVGAIREIGMFERVVAYQVATGSSAEWVKGPGAMGLTTGDYSRPMREHFRKWLEKKYNGDGGNLREAWADTTVDFHSAEVPSRDDQVNTTMYTFRDPAKERNVIDYYECLAELSAELCTEFCGTVKKATQRQALAGAFYGYLTELAWNAGFFGEGSDSEFSTYQRSGHLGLKYVLRSPDVDFLVSPYSYGFRGIGGDTPAMPPAESMRLHNKLYLYEDDTRTHLTHHDHPNFGKADTLEESIALLKRNFAYVITHGQGIWWLAGGSPKTPHIELSQQPAFRDLIKSFQDIGTFSLKLDRSPSAEIAVLLDDESLYYESIKNNLDIPLIFQQRLWGIPHMGAPHDIYLMQDFLEGPVKPYKMLVFLNPFHMNAQRREQLKRKTRHSDQVCVWIYAPGYLEETASLDSMTDLTGIRFDSGEHPWGPYIHLINLAHPITKGLNQDITWGTNNLLGPVFHVDDQQAVVLGNVVYSKGRCRPGFVVKEFGNWRSVYSAAPNLPAPILRNLARYAGVHIYNGDGDVLYATRELLSVHSAAGGDRVFKLPEKVELVFNLFDRNPIAQDTDEFKIYLPPSSTSLFYTGKKEMLEANGTR